MSRRPRILVVHISQENGIHVDRSSPISYSCLSNMHCTRSFALFFVLISFRSKVKLCCRLLKTNPEPHNKKYFTQEVVFFLKCEHISSVLDLTCDLMVRYTCLEQCGLELDILFQQLNIPSKCSSLHWEPIYLSKWKARKSIPHAPFDIH